MSLWLAADPLVLASQSVVRRTLLTAVGVPLEVRAAELDERSLEAAAPSLPTSEIARILAREKASLVARSWPGRLVLGADQTLGCGAERFAKPSDRATARAQLSVLRGRTHELHAAIAFVQDTTVLFEYVETARLTMRAFSDSFLDRYLEDAGAAATTSVGAYQLEGPGIQLFEQIDGDHFTILGLPLMPALAFLRRRGCLMA